MVQGQDYKDAKLPNQVFSIFDGSPKMWGSNVVVEDAFLIDHF